MMYCVQRIADKNSICENGLPVKMSLDKAQIVMLWLNKALSNQFSYDWEIIECE